MNTPPLFEGSDIFPYDLYPLNKWERFFEQINYQDNLNNQSNQDTPHHQENPNYHDNKNNQKNQNHQGTPNNQDNKNIPNNLINPNNQDKRNIDIHSNLTMTNEESNIIENNNSNPIIETELFPTIKLVILTSKHEVKNEGKNKKIKFIAKKTQRENFEYKEKKHDKYVKENMLKKLKIAFINKNGIINFTNSTIRNDNKLLKSLGNKLFLEINTDKLKESNVQYNKGLLNKKIKDILNVEISKIYGKEKKDYNIKLIDQINACEEGKIIKDILEKTFLECLRYYRKDKEYINNIKYSCLNGLQNQFDNLIEKLKEKHEEKYVNEFIDFIKNYENFIEKRIPKDKK